MARDSIGSAGARPSAEAVAAACPQAAALIKYPRYFATLILLLYSHAVPLFARSSVPMTYPATTQLPRQTRHTRASISLPDGEILIPRAQFAADVLKVSDKTAARMNLPTTYIGGVAYVKRDASLKSVAGRVKQRNELARRRRWK